MVGSGVRLMDLMMSLSVATDLGFGQPPEHMLRSARIGMRLGERLGLEPADLATLYDVNLLTYVGCPVYGDWASVMFGDDIDFRANEFDIDLAGFPAMVYMLRRSGYGTPLHNRAKQMAILMATGGRRVIEGMANHCSAAGLLAKSIGLSADARTGIEQSYARWDGKGVPVGLAGDAIALSARVSRVAVTAEVFHRTGGVDAAVEVVKERSGGNFDPQVVEAITRDPGPLFEDLDEHNVDACWRRRHRRNASS